MAIANPHTRNALVVLGVMSLLAQFISGLDETLGLALWITCIVALTRRKPGSGWLLGILIPLLVLDATRVFYDTKKENGANFLVHTAFVSFCIVLAFKLK